MDAAGICWWASNLMTLHSAFFGRRCTRAEPLRGDRFWQMLSV